jgi:hypothetical protein
MLSASLLKLSSHGTGRTGQGGGCGERVGANLYTMSKQCRHECTALIGGLIVVYTGYLRGRVRHIVYRCLPRHQPHNVPVLAIHPALRPRLVSYITSYAEASSDENQQSI